MKLKTRIYVIGLIGLFAMMSYSAFYALPGHQHAQERHQGVKSIKSVCGLVDYVSAVNAVAVLPGKMADVPQTKVYGRRVYFGMIIGSDISHRYKAAKIRFRGNGWNHYCEIPPTLHLS